MTAIVITIYHLDLIEPCDIMYIPFNVEELRALVRDEIRQLKEEGRDVQDFEEEFNRLSDNPYALIEFYNRIRNMAPIRPDYPFVEPSSFEQIRSLRDSSPRRLEVKLDRRTLHDKILGGWIGRCIGCMIGKPVEGWSKEEIARRLKKISEYPLRGYFPAQFFTENELTKRLSLTRGNISQVERDDDIDYTIMNTLILYELGLDFTTYDIGKYWLSKLPYNMVYTAERAAYRNLIMGLKPPMTAIYLNPYREWIGAQIRADAWGYVLPGNPERAAELAYKDARLSHTKNGIYGEMFVSAMISSAFVLEDPEEIVKIGLSEIPKTSRLYEAISQVIEWWHNGISWEEALDNAIRRYGTYSPVHTINNAVLVVIGLLWGEMDFTKAVTITVMGGWDTDCNGATVGSIYGVMLGYNAIPKDLKAPLNDRIKSAIAGFDKVRISDMALISEKLAIKFMKHSS